MKWLSEAGKVYRIIPRAELETGIGNAISDEERMGSFRKALEMRGYSVEIEPKGLLGCYRGRIMGENIGGIIQEGYICVWGDDKEKLKLEEVLAELEIISDELTKQRE